MNWHDLFIALVALGSEFIGTISGFGSSTFFMPIGVLFEKYNFILVLTAFLHVFGNLSKLFLFRRHFNRDLFWKFAIPSVLLAGFGAVLNQYISFDKLKLALGIFITSLAIIFFFKQKIMQTMSFTNAKILVGLSGFVTGLLGTGGALRGMALASLQIEKNSFVALSAGIDLSGDLLRAAIYLYNSYFDWSHWFYVPILILVAYVGSLLGKVIINKINQKQFEKIVVLFIFISGLALIYES